MTPWWLLVDAEEGLDICVVGQLPQVYVVRGQRVNVEMQDELRRDGLTCMDLAAQRLPMRQETRREL